MGKPAASAEVHVAGRSGYDSRSKIAPESALHEAGCGHELYISYSTQWSTSTEITCRSPVLFGPPSIGALSGVAYGPGSLSSGHVKLAGYWVCMPGTVTYGMPIGPPP